MKTGFTLLFLISAAFTYGQTEADSGTSPYIEKLNGDSDLKMDSRQSLSAGEQDRNNNSKREVFMNEFDPNFAHTVYFWLKNPESEEDRAAFEKSLGRFLEHSAYAKTKFIGKPPRASRDVVDGSFTYSLIVTFESAEAQKKYQDEPPHKRFVEESEELWEKVIVYDSQSID